MPFRSRRHRDRTDLGSTLINRNHRVVPLVRVRSEYNHDPVSSLLRGRQGPVGGHASVQAGRSISYQATPAGPERPTGGKILNKPHNTAGTVMQNQPARRSRSMTMSRYVRFWVVVSMLSGLGGDDGFGLADDAMNNLGS
jgi:hypothetical protein